MDDSFAERCYSLLRKVPEGAVTTYGELARALDTKAYRAVGRAMNQNPYAPEVPCHRVVCSDGSLGGFATGTNKKIKLLEGEGVSVRDNHVVDFKGKLFKFSNRG